MQHFNYNNARRIKWTGVYVIMAILLFSCKKFVQVPPPTDKLVTTSVFANSATANQAMLNIYGSMAKARESYYLSLNGGLLADEFQNFSATTSFQISFYKNALTPMMSVATQINGCWQNAYFYIYQANAIIEGMKDNSAIPALIEQRLIGESKFIRAFWHFYLTLSYGDVPIVTGTDYTVNRLLARSSRSLVYQQIITDLKDAESALSDNFLDGTDTAQTNERLRPTIWAAHALLARAYLYNQQYENAETEASAVINHSALFALDPDLNKVFLANSSDAIWQNAFPVPDAINTGDGNNFILLSAPVGSKVSLSTFLLNSFEPGDNRRVNWVNGTATTPVYYYPYKYKIRISTTPDIHSEYVMVLRLSEQYLIRAEARVQNQNIPGALDDLNAIRHRAGLTDYAGAQDQASVLAAILHERQVELFSEWGHRWFDLARTGTINTVMSTVTPAKGGTWDPSGYQQLFPIPQSERLRNPNLSQNAGYN